MKNSLTCPKCDGQKLWRVEHFSTNDDYSNTEGDRLYVTKNRGFPTNTKRGMFSGAVKGGRLIGEFDLFLCSACGYSELWAHSFDKLSHDPDRGVHLIEPTT